MCLNIYIYIYIYIYNDIFWDVQTFCQQLYKQFSLLQLIKNLALDDSIELLTTRTVSLFPLKLQVIVFFCNSETCSDSSRKFSVILGNFRKNLVYTWMLGDMIYKCTYSTTRKISS